jgi:hypothetical protein
MEQREAHGMTTLDKAKQALHDHVFETLSRCGLVTEQSDVAIITVSMLRAVANEERLGLPELRVQWLLNYYMHYAHNRGAPFQKNPKLALQNAFDKARPEQQIEHVFDQALTPDFDEIEVQPSDITFSVPKEPVWLPPAHRVQPVSAYESLRKRFGWDSEAKIKIENALQASQIKPSEAFLDWLDGAFKRYFSDLSKVEKEQISGPEGMERFLDKFAMSGEMWRNEDVDEPLKRNVEEAVDVSTAHVPIHACTRFVEFVYDPSTQFDSDLHMRTSFTNRLKAVDWAYHLQID